MALTCLLLPGLVMAQTTVPTPAGTVITMKATLTWQPPAGSGSQQSLSLDTTQATFVTGDRTPSSVAFLTYAPGAKTLQPAGPTQCLASGMHIDMVSSMPPPVSAQGTTLDPDNALPLDPADLYYPGDPVFIEVTDHDQNLNPNQRDSIIATVSVIGTSQVARVRLLETSDNSGEFVGYVLTSAKSGSAPCELTVKANQKLLLSYTDASDPADSSHADAAISPYNFVFNDTNGTPINGATVTLVNAQTGLPVNSTGRDGTSDFPASVTSGQSVTDASGAHYPAANGTYLMPDVAPGTYRLKVVPPKGYRLATNASDAQLQKLPGAPFTLGPASFGKAFTLTHAQPVGFDIPLTPVSTSLFVSKTASTSIASVGDMVQFTVNVQNSDKQLGAADVRLVDTLPQGFRYVAHSARVILAGATTAGSVGQVITPTLSADGQVMTFNLGELAASGSVQITYVTNVSAATSLGLAINRARGFADGGATSNLATAQVHIQNDLMQNVNTIIGRVTLGCDLDHDNQPAPIGIPGVRILMEDGSYTMTDAEGRYHFPDVTNGTHVVQLDVDSLPKGYVVMPCHRNTRHAGRAWSQFVEVHGGALWHADFAVRKLPPPVGKLTMTLTQQRHADAIDSTLDIHVDTVPVNDLSATVLLPEGARYVPKSARLDGQPLKDVQSMGGALVLRLGERPAGWHGALHFTLTAAGAGHVQTTATLLNFDTPAGKDLHSAVVKLSVQPAQVSSVATSTPTQGLSPAAPLPTAATTPDPHAQSPAAGHARQNKPQGIHLDPVWFAAAGPTPTIVLPKPDANPASPAIQIAIKHAPDEQVRLTINGQSVSSRNRIGVRTNARRTAAVSEWMAVPVTPGNNHLVAEIVRDHTVIQRLTRDVHYSGMPVAADIVAARSVLVADGKTRPVIAVRLTDRWGRPVREGLSGHFTLSAPYQSWQAIQQLQDNPLGATAAARQPTYTVGKDGIALVELAPTTDSGQLTLTVPLANQTQQQLHVWLKAGLRHWVLVGLATGTAAFNQISGHMQSLNGDDPNQDLFQNGRVAFYAKGTIKGSYLLTLAYDTAKKKGLSPSGLTSLGQQIDPNETFMLYGDASHVGHDAQSQSKLYLRIERGTFSAMFGEYDTALDATELARYDRRFNGAKNQYRGKHIGYTAFAARNAQSFVKDTIQGNGTSGLYHLSHSMILVDSESITLVTRDRYHPERVVSSQPLSRFVDYTIDYTTGAIFFKQPVPAIDANLDPVYIVASYEIQRPGKQDITAGGRINWHSTNNHVEVGATAIDEGSSLGHNHLSGVDLRAQVTPTTVLKAEVAHSHVGGAAVDSSLTGYNPFGSVATSSKANTSGLAWLVNIKHTGERLQGEVYARQIDTGFGLGQLAFGQSGMRKAGADGTYVLDQHWRFHGEAWHTQSLADGTRQNAADVQAQWKDKHHTLSFGVRQSDDHYLDVSNYGSTPATTGATSVQTGDGHTTQLEMGGSTQVFHDKLKLHANTSQNIASGNGDAAVPSMTNLGADYQLTSSTSLFINQQFFHGGKVPASRMLQMGVRSQPWDQAQLTSSIGQQQTEYGPRLFATTGLTQGWTLNPHVTLNAGLNQSKSLRSPDMPANATTHTVISASGDGAVPGAINPATPSVAGVTTEDYTSGFLGAAWHRKDWAATSRMEMLHSTSEQRLGVMGGLYHQLAEGTGMAASLQGFRSQFQQGGRSEQVNLRLSFAHRPNNGYWSFLEQLQYVYGNQQDLSGSPFLAQGATGIVASQAAQQNPSQLAAEQGTASTFGINQRDRKFINNLQINYRTRYFEWSLYIGLKYATYHFDSGNYAGLTSMISSESRYDISPDWDFGLVMSRLTTYSSDVSKNGFGVELGHSFGKNMWVSLGYNVTGFDDHDFSCAQYTAQGPFIRFRMKFDQDTIKHMLEGNQP